MEYQTLSFPVILASLLFTFILVKLWTTSSKPNFPGPRKLPFIGNLHLMGSLPHRSLRELAKLYGDIMHIQLGEVSNIVISSTEAAKQVMKTHDINFAQRPFHLVASIITYNFSDIAFAPYGDYWRQMRKICILELLSAKRVLSFRSIREGEVSNSISQINATQGSEFNLSKLLSALIYVITARASFGKKCKDQDAFIPVAEEIMQAAGGFSLADVFPSIKLLQTINGMKAKLQRLSREADKVIENIITEHKAKKNVPTSDSDQVDDLVDVLLKLQEHGNFDIPITNECIKAIVVEVFIAGTETSATTVEWAMSELLKNPRVMEKAQAEVRKVGDRKGNVEEEDVHELNYLKLVIKEALRLHSPFPLLLPRECRESCEINGIEVPAKTTVIVNAWAIARDPNNWKNPDTFYPERFLGSSIDYKGNNFELIPFGAGRRMCPGLTFGMADVEPVLAQLLYHFDWKLANGQKLETLDMEETFGITVRRKNDLNLIAVPYHPQRAC